MSKGFINSIEETYYDENGNEQVRTVSKTFVHKSDQDPFYMTFVDYIGWMYGIKSITVFKVLNKLLEKAEYNTGIVILGTDQRTEIIESLGISKSALSQAISQLLSSQAIKECEKIDKTTGEVKKYKNTYQINPDMFWKGELKKRAELQVTFQTKYIDSSCEEFTN